MRQFATEMSLWAVDEEKKRYARAPRTDDTEHPFIPYDDEWHPYVTFDIEDAGCGEVYLLFLLPIGKLRASGPGREIIL